MSSAQEKLPATPGDHLLEYYRVLLDHFGPQHWWPARTRLEVILGAILTQNTAWNNVAQALKGLRKAGLLKWAGLRVATLAQLESCVRPAGFYRQKARVIRHFVEWVERTHGDSVARLFAQPLDDLRDQLLSLKGIGPETADAIILYAGGRPSFVADAYTRRVLSRHGLLAAEAGYHATRQFLHQHLPADAALFNEFHALLVEVGKRHCRSGAPLCQDCPLEGFLPGTRNGRTRLAPSPAAEELRHEVSPNT